MCREEVLQAFGGSEDRLRPPTAAHEAVVAMVETNPGAGGVVAWDYPTNPEISAATNGLAKVLSSTEMIDFLLSATMDRLPLSSNFDAAEANWKPNPI